MRLGPELLGEPFSEIAKKKRNIHPFLEGGEGETAVLDAPFFKQRILIKDSEIASKGDTAELMIRDAVLAEKGISHGTQ